MITEYHRPLTLESALELLKRQDKVILPLAGGTLLNRKVDSSMVVMDIQDLPLKDIRLAGTELRLGAGVTLQQMIDHPVVPDTLKQACQVETSFNLRQMSTIGGCIAGAGGRSTLLALLLAYNSRIEIQPGDEVIAIGEMLPVRGDYLRGKLITTVILDTTCRVTCETVEKTPADQPIAGVTLAQWPSGRTRAYVYGFGPHPKPALDGPSAAGLEPAVKNAFAGSDDLHASSAYREALAGILVNRCMNKMERQ